jgi:peptidyl-prolyl cis-trans isomerase A (cyclophilin A)
MTLFRASVITLLMVSLVACRAPRDPDLDERIEAHRAGSKKPIATSAPPKAQAKPNEVARDPNAPPPKGQVEVRVYSDDQLTAVMSSLPGEGPGIELGLETADGTITCKLDVEGAPQTTANVIALATGRRSWRDPDTGDVSRGRFYDGLTFHRTIANFIIQTGNPSATGAGGPGWTITREAGIKDAYTKAGVLSMVDAGEDSHGSQFFITTRASSSLEGRYTPFGTCDNSELVKKIADADKHPPKAEGKSATRSLRPTRIKRMTLKRTAL